MATIRTTVNTSDDTAKAEVRIPLSEVRKPLYAYVGAADAALEKIRNIPTVYVYEAKKLSGRVNDISSHAQKLPASVQTVVRSLPSSVTSQLSDLQGRASSLYNNFADRGERRVSSIRRNPATEEATEQTREAVGQTKTDARTSRRAADAVEKAIGDTAAPPA